MLPSVHNYMNGRASKYNFNFITGVSSELSRRAMMYLLLGALVALLSIVNCEYHYETKTFEVPLDHFSYHRNETFHIKYLENEEYWDASGGPIFFYTGNEVSMYTSG